MAKQAGKGKGAAGHGTHAETQRSLDDEVDGLFQLPLGEFTAARNALAARLKKEGKADESNQVKALAKPSVSAWTANQLYWKARDAFDRLLEAGERFRKAQAAQLSGKSSDLRGPLDARREALGQVARLATDILREAGNNPTPEMMRRVTTTLEALSTYASLPNAPRPGRLTDDVDPPGFETLAALVPRIGGSGASEGPTRVIPFQQKARPAKPAKRSESPDEARAREEERKAQVAAAKDTLREAETTLRQSRADAQRAETALKKAAAETKDAEKEKADAEARLEKATAAVEEARQQGRRVAADAENAAQIVEDAERAVERARAELERLAT